MKHTNTWWQYLVDPDGNASVEIKRKTYAFLILSYLGILFLSIFAYKNVTSGDYLLLGILFGCLAVVSTNLTYFYLSHKLILCCRVGSLLILLLSSLLTYQGGVENTGLYWIYVFPAVLFIVLGAKEGLILNLILFVMLAVILLTPDLVIAQYRDVEVTRFLTTIFALMMICFVGEHYRK